MTCLSSFGTFIPQSNVVLDIDKSLRPDSTNLVTSFLLVVGRIKLGFCL